jgi:hypothetical protein
MQPLHISLNQEDLSLHNTDTSSVADLLDQIQREHLAPNEVFASIYINGTAWSDDAPNDTLRAIPALGIQRLEVFTQTADAVASAGLQDLSLILSMIRDQLREATPLLRGHQIAEGFAAFLQGADMLHDALYFLRLYLDHRSIPQEHHTRADYQTTNDTLTEVLITFEHAQQRQDWNLLADLIEYEIIPAVDALDRLGDALASLEDAP